MNIPPEIARAQGKHGIKGAAHGIKGGRPKLDMTDEERTKHRRKQHETYRRKKGIPPKEVLTFEERKERAEREHRERWDEEFRRVWRKLPGEPLKDWEFRQRYPAFRKWVQDCQNRNFPLKWKVQL